MPLTNATAGVADPNAGGLVSDLTSVAGLGANIYGLVNAANLNSAAQTNLQQSNPFGQYRPQYGAQLSALMANPSSVTSLPGYQFMMDQGTQAIARGSAAPGGNGLGSGGMGAELETYGQGVADQFYQQQVATLSGLAGANISPANPSAALAGAGGAAGSIGNSIAGLTGSIGSTLGVLGKLFPGTSATSGAAAQAGYNPALSGFTGAPGQTSVDWAGGDAGSNFTGQIPGVPSAGSGFTGDPGNTSVDWGMGGGGANAGGSDIPSFDLGDIFSNPNSAGGQATPGASASGTNSMAAQWGLGGLGGVLGAAGTGIGIVSGALSGKPTGEAGAALSTAKVASGNGLLGSNSGAINAGATQGLDALSIYSGLKQGGVAGYATAANGAYGLATGTAGIPGVGQALSVYNFAKNWQSGDTGGDALRGAEAGASIGSVVPVIGTLIGGVIGGAVGAISSAFGSGKVDPENASFEGFTQAYNKAPDATSKAQVAAATANPYLPLAGLFDLRSNQIKGNIPIVDQYGRAGEQKFVTDMFSKINAAAKSGTISKSSSADDVMSKVVTPWINSFGKGTMSDSNSDAINAMLSGLTDDYITGQQGSLKAIGGQAVFANVPAFGS